jgi:hypothetical protein
MRNGPISLFILIAATQGCLHPAASSGAPSPPPSGWWVIETARAPDEASAWTLVHDLGVPGAAWRFATSELDAVRPGYLVDRVAVVLRADGTDAWQLLQGVPHDDHVCRLERAGARIALRCAASDALLTFRLALPEEAQSAEHALAQHGSAEAACARAAGCAAVALETFPYLDEYAPHGAADLRVCEAATLVFARQYRLTGHAVPPACAP